MTAQEACRNAVEITKGRSVTIEASVCSFGRNFGGGGDDRHLKVFFQPGLDGTVCSLHPITSVLDVITLAEAHKNCVKGEECERVIHEV